MIGLIIFVGAFLLFTVSLRRPAILAAVLILLTFLVSGMARGSIVPLFRPNEIILLLIFCVYVLRKTMAKQQAGDYPFNISFIDKGFLVLLLGTGIIPLIRTFYLSGGFQFKDIATYLGAVQYFLLYKIVSGVVKNKRDLKMVLYAFMVAGMIVSFLAILEALHVQFVEDLLWQFYPSAHLTKAQSYTRVVSILGSWGGLGAFCAIQILVCALLLFRHKGLIDSRLLYACMGLSALAFVPSVTIAPAVGLLIGGLYLFSERKRRKYIVLALLLVGIGVWVFWPFVQNRLTLQFGEVGNGELNLVPTTFTHRLMLWSEIYLPVIRQNFIFGYGADIPVEIGLGITTTQESQYFGLLYQSGVIGLLAHLAYVAIVFTGLLRTYKTDMGFNKIFAEISMVLLVMLSIMGIANAYFTYSGVGESLWLFYALSVCAYAVPTAEVKTGSKSIPAIARNPLKVFNVG